MLDFRRASARQKLLGQNEGSSVLTLCLRSARAASDGIMHAICSPGCARFLLETAWLTVLLMYPVVIGNGRCMTKDTVIGGYQVPKGFTGDSNSDDNIIQVYVVFQHYVISAIWTSTYFPRSSEFLPERCLQADGVRHSFASLPFGYGRRMCLRRRFAELEMVVVISKILQRYKTEYHYEKLDYHINSIYVHAQRTSELEIHRQAKDDVYRLLSGLSVETGADPGYKHCRGQHYNGHGQNCPKPGRGHSHIHSLIICTCILNFNTTHTCYRFIFQDHNTAFSCPIFSLSEQYLLDEERQETFTYK
ncbi:uncharacterized protein LOC143221989 [Lasioglossum baleicum]|uniref:uncharacterized protein LOC143221989 n=1 Tax=Lasioglossum baleicum TaxID=434251 RepID=UPI003FCD298A